MNPAARMVHIPKGVPVARFRPPPTVAVPPSGELPMIAKDTPDSRKVQEVWVTQIRVFDLSDDTQRGAYETVWQKITDGLAIVAEHRVDFHEGRYVALLRWADLTYKLPET